MTLGLPTRLESKIDIINTEVSKIKYHLHNFEKWFGLAAVPAGETHRADRMSGTTQPFQLVAGNNTFGNWVQVLGSSDTPVKAGKTYFDLHRCIIQSTNSTNMYLIQLVSGESAGIAAKLLTEDYDEFPYISSSNNNDSGISDIIDKRCAAGQKLWMRCACVGANGTVINFYFGIHEYDL